MDHHGLAGQGSEGFSGESDGGVTRGDNGENRHAFIAGKCILAPVLRQETAPRARGRSDGALARPAVAASYLVLALVVAAAAVRGLARAHEDRMHLATGKAEWIWYTSSLPQPRPLRFYATREVVLSQAPARATAKLFVDREHVLYVNGARAGSGAQRPGDPLAAYEVAALMRPGVNRIAIEAASPTGVGGILFSLDVAGLGRDALVSDGRWRVDLSADAIAAGGRYRPVVWGSPPQSPWGYPAMPKPSPSLGD
jgi:hypothetical protein